MGGCKYIASAIVTLEMRGPMSLCLGLSTVLCTGYWCSQWRALLLGSAFQQLRGGKREALRLVLLVWHK